MNAAAEAALSERRMIAAGLRMWPSSVGPTERALTSAAVELVIRARHGEFADPSWPWVREGDTFDPLGLFWLDVEAMTAWNGGRPEQPVMSFVEALSGGRPARLLREQLRWLDRVTVRLVMCAFDHVAAGAGRGIAVYAFGGDPHQLVDTPAEPLPWPVDELDRQDRPAVEVEPRLRPVRVAGVRR